MRKILLILILIIPTSYIQPKLFVQFRHGYDEFMIDYNKKNKALRAGLVF